jgi:hypothetical protein
MMLQIEPAKEGVDGNGAGQSSSEFASSGLWQR